MVVDGKPATFLKIASEAVHCERCFDAGWVKRSTVNRAQPRWIGPSYPEASLKIVWVMLNPGSGDGRRDDADQRLRGLLEAFASGECGLRAVFEHQRADIPNWGDGRLLRFLKLAGIELDRIALLNVAWCATSGNKYPPTMLKTCFQRFSSRALSALAPDLVVLSGNDVHRFAADTEASCPNATIIKTLHYAHRKGTLATEKAAAEIRKEIARATGVD